MQRARCSFLLAVFIAYGCARAVPNSKGRNHSATTRQQNTFSISESVSKMKTSDVDERRRLVLSMRGKGVAGIPILKLGLADESFLVRRAAVRTLADLGDVAVAALEEAWGNDDGVTRRAALIALAGEPTTDSIPYLAKALQDDDPQVRALSIKLLVTVKPRTTEILSLLHEASADASDKVKGMALAALDPKDKSFESLFQRETILLRDRADMADHISRIVVTKRILLPTEGWKFRKDVGLIGHREKWYEPSFDTGSWEEGVIETPWEKGYVGVGWYRTALRLPSEPENTLAVELAFEGVDENAWVWINGIFVGSHAIGPSGWNKPFRLDVTEEIRWNGENIVVVRAKNTKGAGGIWKPVVLEALSLN